MIAGTLTLADRPCVDRGLSEPVTVNLRKTPPRFPEVVSTGSSFQVTGHGGRGYWVQLGTAAPYVHCHRHRPGR